jgi:hypothetical protein
MQDDFRSPSAKTQGPRRITFHPGVVAGERFALLKEREAPIFVLVEGSVITLERLRYDRPPPPPDDDIPF